ncbi:uncharacterized protein LOC129598655 isoform X2 [Paramacrobiotus metropolitanus]|uniref:uncharacterized protein LOC129598655 isoform X2 n=1 Tax=Paramacrobiotus metropolitanus TaxID=2943436 RepID=UPI002445926F|nr:uncharacterized protein LOC129598655 isoform X2 [Paramacrobiotus metropolitanus]
MIFGLGVLIWITSVWQVNCQYRSRQNNYNNNLYRSPEYDERDSFSLDPRSYRYSNRSSGVYGDRDGRSYSSYRKSSTYLTTYTSNNCPINLECPELPYIPPCPEQPATPACPVPPACPEVTCPNCPACPKCICPACPACPKCNCDGDYKDDVGDMLCAVWSPLILSKFCWHHWGGGGCTMAEDGLTRSCSTTFGKIGQDTLSSQAAVASPLAGAAQGSPILALANSLSTNGGSGPNLSGLLQKLGGTTSANLQSLLGSSSSATSLLNALGGTRSILPSAQGRTAGFLTGAKPSPRKKFFWQATAGQACPNGFAVFSGKTFCLGDSAQEAPGATSTAQATNSTDSGTGIGQ